MKVKKNHIIKERIFILTSLLGSMAACGYIAHFSPDVPTEQVQASVQVEQIATVSASLETQPSVEAVKLDSFTVASSSTGISAKDQSIFIDEAVQEFLPKHYSEALMIMHCLAHRENGHGGNPNAHGDNGLAGGPFQFHQATWNRMRKQMGEDQGSRYDFKEAARTTAWALSKGRAKEWGPILRDSKGSDFATCQTPSWSK